MSTERNDIKPLRHATPLPPYLDDERAGEHGARWMFVHLIRDFASNEAIIALKEDDPSIKKFHQARERALDETANFVRQFLENPVASRLGAVREEDAPAYVPIQLQDERIAAHFAKISQPLDRLRHLLLAQKMYVLRDSLIGQRSDSTFYSQWEKNKAALIELLDALDFIPLYAHPVARVPEPATGAELIAAERQRQVRAEGWSASHDDSHNHGELAISAACYAAHGTDAEVSMHGEDAMGWGSCHDKRNKHDRLRQLTIAGALIAAEIDRLLRLKSQPSLLVEMTEPSERRVLVWLVERNDAATPPVWLRSTLGDVEWTTDAYAAVQFETAYDANREITRRGGPIILFARAVEHSLTYKSPGTPVETTDTPEKKP